MMSACLKKTRKCVNTQKTKKVLVSEPEFNEDDYEYEGSDLTNCPNCGAPIEYGKTSCAYCGTRYVVRR